jgi:hypothetical protein
MTDTYRCPNCEQDVPCYREHSWTECSGHLKAQIKEARGVGRSLFRLMIYWIDAAGQNPEPARTAWAGVYKWLKKESTDHVP